MKTTPSKTRKTLGVAALLAALAAGAATPAFAADAPASQPVASTAPAGELKVQVVAVEGLVSIRRDENAKWERAAVGMTFGEGTEVRTGPRSAIQLRIEPNQTVTLDRLGSCRIARAMFENGKVVTDVVMPYGRVRYDVEAAGVEHDCKVHTPSSTLAIRGTQTIAYDQPPFPSELRSLVGEVRGDFAKRGREAVPFGGLHDATLDEETLTPADFARDLTILDPGAQRARTPLETQLIADLPSQNGIGYNQIRPPRPRLPGGGGGLINTAFLGGDLIFTASWNSAADVDLFVSAGNRTIAQKNLGNTNTTTAIVLDPSGADTAPSVGHVVGPDATGSVSQTQTESIRVGSRVPLGQYKYGAFLQNAGNAGNADTNVNLTVQFVKGNKTTTLANPNVILNRDAPRQARTVTVTSSTGN